MAHTFGSSGGVAAALRHTIQFPRGARAQTGRGRTASVEEMAARLHAASLSSGPEDDDTDFEPMTDAMIAALKDPGQPAAPAELPEAVKPGSIVGNYRVIELIANGGMGVIFLGEHLHLGRRVALKFLHQRLSDDGWAASRFFAEAVATTRIAHPGVVAVFDYGPFEGGTYLAMEYLQGEALSTRLSRDGGVPVERVLDIGKQVALALSAAHEAGIIHRDLKPENVFLVRDPSGTGRESVKVLDFGVAKITRGATVPLTQRGDVLGTPSYMAPEQSVHAGQVDHRCDIYSLGCLLYQLVTGNPPFRGSMLRILMAHQTEAPAPPSALAPWIPAALNALILRMLAKSPAERPETMAEVAQALSAIESEMAAPLPLHARQPGAVWLGIAFGLGLAGVIRLIW